MTSHQQPSNPSTNLAQRLDIDFALQAVGVGVWDLDIIWQQVWWDDRCKRMYGFEQDDIVPYSQVLQYMHPDDRQRVDQAVQWALNPQSKGHYDIQFRTVGASDGQLRWLHCRGQAFFDDQGQAYRFSGIAQEVTQLVQAQQKVEHAQQQIFNAIDNLPTGLGVFVMEGPSLTFQVVNPYYCQLTGYLPEQVIGRPLLEVRPEHKDQPYVGWLKQVMATGQPFTGIETPGKVLRDGQLKEVFNNFAYTPYYQMDGTISGVIGMFVDVTAQVKSRQTIEQSEQRYRQLAEHLEQQVQERTEELAAANEELAASNEELTASNEDIIASNQALETANTDLLRSNQNLEQFAYIASHDLQEPLRKIQQFGDLLKNRFFKPESEELLYLERMQTAAARMSLLIKDLLTFSRISTSQVMLQPVALNQIITRALENLSVAVEGSQAQVEVSALPTVQGDPSQLSQLFQNLLSNALKFRRLNPAGGMLTPLISIKARQIARTELPASLHPTRYAEFYHLIEVSDNGIGFDEKYKDRIFQVFQRLHGKNEFAGTGIGLAIVQKVVSNHGGAITVNSKPGQGATFCVYLPA